VELLNPTDLVMDQTVFRDRHGAEQVVMALKGTWNIAPDVFLTGSAKAPAPGTRVMDIRLRVGNIGRTARVFGPIGRHCKPRVQLAGTYDDSWTEDRMPLLPDDFQERFHNAAPVGLADLPCKNKLKFLSVKGFRALPLPTELREFMVHPYGEKE